MTETKKSTTGALRQKPLQPGARGLKTYAERLAAGKALRDACPRSAHANWKEPHDRPDPISLVLKADEGRVPELLPLHHERHQIEPTSLELHEVGAVTPLLTSSCSDSATCRCH